MSLLRQFLKDNFDYNEVKALEVFAECGMYELLFEVARVGEFYKIIIIKLLEGFIKMFMNVILFIQLEN